MWLSARDIDPDLIAMIDEYLMAQGSKSMMDCSPPACYTALARAHDRLGWDNFVEGRICTAYLDAFQEYADDGTSPYSIDNWGRGLVERLIQLSHAQWIFRNSHVHFKKLEGMTRAQHEDIFQKVKDLMWTDPMSLLPKHRHLLEEDFEALGEGSSMDRSHWAANVEAALLAADHAFTGGEMKNRSSAFREHRCARVTARPTNKRPTATRKPRHDGSLLYGPSLSRPSQSNGT